MPKVTAAENPSAGLYEFTVTLTPEDYKENFLNELKKYRKEGSFKGFRKGKTPMSFLRKMFGERVLSQLVNDAMAEATQTHVDETPRTYGTPLPAKDAQQIELDPKELGTYEYKMQVGQYPELELKGLDDGTAYQKYRVRFTDAEVEEFLQKTLVNAGKSYDDTEKIEDEDLVKLTFTDNETDGISGEFSLPLDRATETAKETILGLKPGDAFTHSVYDLEQDTEREFVHRNLLGIEDEDLPEGFNGELEFTIVHGTRRVPAELNAAFIKEHFGEIEAVTDEASLREHLRQINEEVFNPSADALLMRDFQDRLMELNKDDIEINEDYAKMLLIYGGASKEYKQRTLSNDKRLQKHFDNVRWEIIQMHLIERFGIEITEEDLRDGFRQQVRGYFGGANLPMDMGDFLESMVDRLMNGDDPKPVNEMIQTLTTEKLGKALEEAVTIQEESVTVDEIQEKIKETNDRFAEAEAVLAADDPREEE